MPTITLDTKYLLKLIGSRMSHEKLSSQIGKLGFDVEKMDANEISIEVTPNRPDLFGAVGFSRALRNFMHKSKKLRYQLKDSEPALAITVGKEVQRIRPFIVSLVAKGMSLDTASLEDLINFTEKLCEISGRNRRKIAIGLHDLDRIEPPLYYNAFEDERFVPLNSTNEEYYSEVIRRHEKGKEYGYTIEGTGLYPVLKDNRGVLSLIPILNSERTKVTTKTKNILVDMTGPSLDTLSEVIDLLAATFMDMGADVGTVRVGYTNRTTVSPSMPTRLIQLTLSQAESEIGVRIGFNNIISLANKMGYEAALVGKSIRFRIPEYRTDIINEQDIIEDIAIAYGYDFIQPVSIPSTQKGELEEEGLLFDRLSERMVGIGYSEMLNTYLTNERINFEDMRIKDADSYLSSYGAERIKLKNPKARSITMMRTWLLPSLLRNIGISTHEKMPQRLFELDMVFYLTKGVPKEEYHLAGISADSRSNFNYMKGVVEAIVHPIVTNHRTERYEHESFIKGRCARMTAQGRTVGLFGELHPEVLGNFGIDEPCVAFEFML